MEISGVVIVFVRNILFIDWFVLFVYLSIHYFFLVLQILLLLLFSGLFCRIIFFIFWTLLFPVLLVCCFIGPSCLFCWSFGGFAWKISFWKSLLFAFPFFFLSFYIFLCRKTKGGNILLWHWARELTFLVLKPSHLMHPGRCLKLILGQVNSVMIRICEKSFPEALQLEVVLISPSLLFPAIFFFYWSFLFVGLFSVAGLFFFSSVGLFYFIVFLFM